MTSFTSVFPSPPAAENPISEGGVWVENDPAHTKVQTLTGGGFACGTQAGAGPRVDDSVAYLNGLSATLGLNYSVELTLWKKAGLNATFREVQCLLRWSDTGVANSSTGYAIDLEVNGSYGEIGTYAHGNVATLRAPPTPVTGDKLKLAIVDQAIVYFFNGVPQALSTGGSCVYDSSVNKVTTGDPGMAYFINDGTTAAPDDYRATKIDVQPIPNGFFPAQGGAANAINGSSTSNSAVLGNPPKRGDLVCVGFSWVNGGTGIPASLTVQDSNGNVYQKSPSSPRTNAGASHYEFFLLNAPANASATITATYTDPGASGATILHADDFFVLGGTAIFDQDAVGTGTGTAINSPTIGVAKPNSLVHFYVGSANGVTTVDSPFGEGRLDSDANASGYLLNASSATAVAATQTTGGWDAVGMSFSFIPYQFRTLPRARPRGQGPLLKAWLQSHAFKQNVGPKSTVVVFASAIGAWAWAGIKSMHTTIFGAGLGPWTWAGKASSLSVEILAKVGKWTWAGVKAAVATSIAPTMGRWTWAGLASPLSKMVNAGVGAWTWSGTHATFNPPIAASVGAWAWAGVKAAFSTEVTAGKGAWTWRGIATSVTVPGAAATHNLYPDRRRRGR